MEMGSVRRNLMKAIVYTEFGPPEVLQLKEVDKPAPKDNEVLIKNYATSVTVGDVNARDFSRVPPGFGPLPRLMFGIRGPRKPVIGSDIAGEIEAIGKDVQQFKVGDQVYGIDGENLGAYAEYVCRPEDGALATMPTNMTYKGAAAIPFGACTALYFLRDQGNIQSGQEVLINGASGGVGVYAVQLAKYFGADVTGVCSTKNLDTVRALGADKVIDYTQEDFTKNGETYDLIFDMVGKNTSFSRYKNSLKQNGAYLAVAGGLKEMLQMQWTRLVGDRKVIFGGGTASERKDYLIFFKELIEAGDLKAVIDGSYPLEQTAEAHRFFDGERKRGSVVITVEHSD
jgi:NADPH:quinone reductase-like Zn-dependent oxidoreductase